MKKRKALFVFLICSLFWAYSPAPTVFAKEIKWRPVKEGMILGKEEGKKILIHFYTDWCGYCTMMREETFRDPKVISYINRNYIPIRVDNDKESMDGIVAVGLPDTWFLTSEGETIAHQPGFIDANRTMDMLKYVSTDSYGRMGFKEFLESGEREGDVEYHGYREYKDSWNPENF